MVKSSAALPEVLSLHRYSNTLKYSPRESGALSWPPQVLHTSGAHKTPIHTK